MTDTADPGKTIALNSFFLYCRKVVQIVIGFYASRLLLERLGEDGFGLYGLVGSVIVLFAALRSVFSSSIVRYINIAKSTGDAEAVGKVFSMGLTIQLVLAVVFCAAVEIGGLFIIPNLNIPQGDMSGAWMVFHLSLLAVVAIMLTVPYEALIVSNQRLGALAVLSVMESVLKLGVVILLAVWTAERVVWYALLMLGVSLVVRGGYSVYCRRAFGREARFRIVRDKKMYREMTVFAGWNFLGGTGNSIAASGINFVLNIFGGLPLNTARGIAMQVEANVDQFFFDISASFSPRSMMAYARGEMESFYRLMFWNSKVNFFVSSVLGCSLIYLMYPVLHLWLGEVPAWTTAFTSLILIHTMLGSLDDPVKTLFHASGRMKWYQIMEFAFMVAIVPLAWLALHLGAPYYSAFIVLVGMEFLCFIGMVLLAHRQLGFDAGRYTRHVLSRVALTAVLLAAGYIVSVYVIPPDLDSLATICVAPCVALLVSLVVFFSLFNAAERKRILSLVKSR